MKLVKSIAKELFILTILFLIALGCAKVLLQLVFEGLDQLDLWLNRSAVVFSIVKIAMFLFIPMVCALYTFRFTLFRPRNILVGIIGIFYWLAALACVWMYEPLYIQLRRLTYTYSSFQPQAGQDNMDAYLQFMIEQEGRLNAAIRNEMFWVYTGILAVTSFLLLLLILTLVKRSRNALPKAKNTTNQPTI
jgi:hypothetical protein